MHFKWGILYGIRWHKLYGPFWSKQKSMSSSMQRYFYLKTLIVRKSACFQGKWPTSVGRIFLFTNIEILSFCWFSQYFRNFLDFLKFLRLIFMHLTAKIQQSYISLSSVNCDASLRTVNLKNRENACLFWRTKSLDADLAANLPSG